MCWDFCAYGRYQVTVQQAYWGGLGHLSHCGSRNWRQGGFGTLIGKVWGGMWGCVVCMKARGIWDFDREGRGRVGVGVYLGF